LGGRVQVGGAIFYGSLSASGWLKDTGGGLVGFRGAQVMQVVNPWLTGLRDQFRCWKGRALDVCPELIPIFTCWRKLRSNGNFSQLGVLSANIGG